MTDTKHYVEAGEYEVGEDYAAAALQSLGEVVCKGAIQRVFDNIASEHGVVFGPVRFSQGVHQTDGPIWVGEAQCLAVQSGPGRMSASLSARELEVLRAKTREAYAQRWPNEPPLSDEKCDRVIDAIGPGSAAATARSIH